MRNYSLSAIDALLAQTPPRCSVKRSKTGRITSVQLFPLTSEGAAADEKRPLRKTAHLGQHYSYAEQVDESGRKAWRFRRDLTPRTEEEETFLIEVFRAVPLSCLQRDQADDSSNTPAAEFEPTPTPPRPAKVVTLRPRRPAPPCDSESLPVAA